MTSTRLTVSLPSDLLALAERLARTRGVSREQVISEAVQAGLRAQADRSKGAFDVFRQAFQPFSDEEMAMLDGIILEYRPAR